MSKGKGWHNHPYQHALASRGIKTKYPTYEDLYSKDRLKTYIEEVSQPILDEVLDGDVHLGFRNNMLHMGACFEKEREIILSIKELKRLFDYDKEIGLEYLEWLVYHEACHIKLYEEMGDEYHDLSKQEREMRTNFLVRDYIDYPSARVFNEVDEMMGGGI